MCGILGSYGNYENKKFLNALNIIKHRGPDATNYYFKKKIKLGHQRLKVIDLSKNSNQPMFSINNRYSCVYNGEIYNYKKVKNFLERKKYKFRTNSDTEVLINSYDYWKEECVHHFEGMYAFAIVDLRKEQFFLARDPVGIKPLYYSRQNNNLIFSSEVKPIIKLNSNYSLNEKSLSSFLKYRYVVNNETFFKNIFELPKGSMLHFSKDKFKIRKFWETKYLKKNYNLLSTSKTLKEKISKSVKLHLESDIPVSSFLSGGVDSSIITYEMSKILDNKFNTYVAYFENGDKSDLIYSRQVSKLCNSYHNEIKISENDYWDTLKNTIKESAYPAGVPNEIAIRHASKIIKKSNSVILTGEGADELFCGYGRIFNSKYEYQLLKKPQSGKFEKKLKDKYRNYYFDNEVDHFLYLYDYSKMDADVIFNKKYTFDFKSLFGIDERNFNIKKKQKFFLEHHLPGLLKRIDLNTMSSGLEARVPFLTKDLINFALNLDEKLKLKKLEKYPKNKLLEETSEIFDIPKYILKYTYKKYLPTDVLFRKKKGFPVPLDKWFLKKNNKKINSELFNGELVKNDLINKKLLKELIKYNKLNHITLWGLYSLENFLKEYF